jgi:hypothetical protein
MDDTPEARKAREAAEDRHRDRVNKIAAAGLAILLLILVGTVKMFKDHEDLERCVESRRTDCVKFDTPPREGVRTPVR